MPGIKKARRKPMPRFITVIREAAKAQGISLFKLANSQRGAHTATCQAFLYSGRDARASTVEALMRRLDLVVVSGAELAAIRARAAELDRLEREAVE